MWTSFSKKIIKIVMTIENCEMRGTLSRTHENRKEESESKLIIFTSTKMTRCANISNGILGEKLISFF